MPDAVLVGLLALILALVLVLILIVARGRTGTIEGTDRVARALQDSGLFQQVGRVERMAQEMADAGTELRNLFRIRHERGVAGEFQLETLLGDLLPPDRFTIRRNLAGIGTPDAVVETREGRLLIDSKFPLEAYRDLAASDGDRGSARRRFAVALRTHVDSVAAKYVRPETGTLPFAVLFIPSEAVFVAALEAEPRILREASRRGVLLASPTTLSSHLAILAAGIRADELTATARRVQASLRALERRFGEFRAEWETLSRHVGNAHGKVTEVTRRLDSLEEAWRHAVRPGQDRDSR